MSRHLTVTACMNQTPQYCKATDIVLINQDMGTPGMYTSLLYALYLSHCHVHVYYTAKTLRNSSQKTEKQITTHCSSFLLLAKKDFSQVRQEHRRIHSALLPCTNTSQYLLLMTTKKRQDNVSNGIPRNQCGPGQNVFESAKCTVSSTK